MPASKKIIDWRSLIIRESYSTILDILDTVEIPMTLPQLLFILNKPPKFNRGIRTNYDHPVVDTADIEKLKKSQIPIHKFNIVRQRLYKILNLLVEYGLIRRESEQGHGIVKYQSLITKDVYVHLDRNLLNL